MSRKKIKLGWVTPWNTLSDIFACSKLWIEHLSPDDYQLKILASDSHQSSGCEDENAIRCWAEKSTQLTEVEKTIAREAFDAVVIQFHFSLFHLPSLGTLIDFLNARGIVTIIFLNDLDDPAAASLAAIRSQLAQCQRLFVSCIEDLNRFKDLRLVDNVTLFPYGPHEKRLDSSNALGKRLDGMIRGLVQDARWDKAAHRAPLGIADSAQRIAS